MRWLLLAQGGYFFLTGVWPLLDIDSFQRVTGPKTDLWLVKTAGVLIAAIGAGLLVAGALQRIDPGIIVVAIGSSIGLLAVDVIYVSKRVISPIYLGDALLEVALLVWWAACLPGVS